MNHWARDRMAKQAAAHEEARAKAPVSALLGMWRPLTPQPRTPDFLLGPDGPIARSLIGYQTRPGQLSVSNAVLDAFESGGNAAIEAGTGIGKTLAALTSAVLFATKAGGPVIYSTAQLALQDQIISRDAPFLQKNLGIPFKFAYLKGRSNWVCNAQLDGAVHPDGKIARWIAHDRTGDLSNLPFALTPGQHQAITVESEYCAASKCGWYEECFYYTARRRCTGADVINVNHALLVSNALAGGAIFGYPSAIIVDEAHKLEEVTRSMLEVVITREAIHKVIKGAVYNHVITSKQGTACNNAARAFEKEVRLCYGDLKQKHRITDPTAAQELQKRAIALRKKLEIVLEAIGQSPDVDQAAQMTPRIRVIIDALAAYGSGELENMVAWVEKPSPRSSPEMHLAPLSVAEWLKENLWNVPAALMSATLISTKEAGFSTIVGALGLPEPAEVVAESPFSYVEQARYMLPSWRTITKPPHHEDPKKAARLWCDHLEGPMLSILHLTQARSFLLFTASQTMLEMAFRIRKVAPQGWTILVQGEGSKPDLVQRYREASNPVLLGLKTFWEGVDIPGSKLSAVHVDKIPFPSPGDPLEDALRDLAGGFPKCLHAWDIPRAALELKQAFGRGIRSEICRALLVLHDPRARHARYRNTILGALTGWVKPLEGSQIPKIPAWLDGTGEPPLYEVPFQ